MPRPIASRMPTTSVDRRRPPPGRAPRGRPRLAGLEAPRSPPRAARGARGRRASRAATRRTPAASRRPRAAPPSRTRRPRRTRRGGSARRRRATGRGRPSRRAPSAPRRPSPSPPRARRRPPARASAAGRASRQGRGRPEAALGLRRLVRPGDPAGQRQENEREPSPHAAPQGGTLPPDNRQTQAPLRQGGNADFSFRPSRVPRPKEHGPGPTPLGRPTTASKPMRSCGPRKPPATRSEATAEPKGTRPT